MTEIFIGADLLPMASNIEYFNHGDIDHLIGEKLKVTLRSADLILMCLEGPLTDVSLPIEKCGSCLMAPTGTIAGLKKINPFFYTLANNHIMDQNVQGLKSTIKCLEENQIAYAGAGKNLQEAKQPWLTEINGIRIGVYCCAEHEFSIAGEDYPGANPYDPLYSFDHVSDLKNKADLVIVLYHGGKEYYRYPSPELRRVFRKFAEVGADYVIAQQTHCIGCVEEYLGSYLVYGQGNFLFDFANGEFEATSLLLKIMIRDADTHDLELIPCVKKGETVRMADETAAQKILDGVFERSRNILKAGFVEKQYAEFAKSMRGQYYNRLMGKLGRSFFVRCLNKITHDKFQNWIYSKEFLPIIENCFECEAHRELVSSITRLI